MPPAGHRYAPLDDLGQRHAYAACRLRSHLGVALSSWQAANPTTGWQESGLKPASCAGLADPDRALAKRLEQRSAAGFTEKHRRKCKKLAPHAKRARARFAWATAAEVLEGAAAQYAAPAAQARRPSVAGSVAYDPLQPAALAASREAASREAA
jgi:hypothetical protein